jgi:hypothetical protein
LRKGEEEEEELTKLKELISENKLIVKGAAGGGDQLQLQMLSLFNFVLAY